MHLKCKQTIQLKKTSKQPLALVVSKDEFNRLADFKTETEKLSDISAEKTEKLMQLKKLSYEITKDWENAIGTIQKRRREELLSRRKNIEESKVKLMKELTKQTALEHAEIVKEARKLILYRKPQCRLINRALLASECYRELNAQLDFKKELETLEQNEKKQYTEECAKQMAVHMNSERKKCEERLNKMKIYGMELRKQIKSSKLQSRQNELQEMNADKKDLDNMTKELQFIEKCEADQAQKRKDQVKKNYLEAIEEKKRVETKIKHDEDLENRVITAYTKTRDHLNRITKKKWKQSLADKLHRSELIMEKSAIIQKSDNTDTEERLKKEEENYKRIELEKLKCKRMMQEKMRDDIKRYQQEQMAIKEQREKDKKNIIAWETLQRLKKDEYNKQLKLRESQKMWANKMKIANDLRKQMAEDEAARKRELMMEDDSAYIKIALARTNEKVMAYSQEILEESKGVRPLFPIIKAIETFKKNNGLIPLRKYEEIDDTEEDECCKRIQTKQPQREDAFYFG